MRSKIVAVSPLISSNTCAAVTSTVLPLICPLSGCTTHARSRRNAVPNVDKPGVFVGPATRNVFCIKITFRSVSWDKAATQQRRTARQAERITLSLQDAIFQTPYQFFLMIRSARCPTHSRVFANEWVRHNQTETQVTVNLE